MSVRTIAFFNNKRGVGTTSLVYHLAWMYSLLGSRVLAVDLDPQANLTAAFLDDDRLEQLWSTGDPARTVFGAVQPLKEGTGDIADPYLETIDLNLWLLPGDLALSRYEDELSQQWPKCLDRDVRGFRVISAFWRIIQRAAAACEADLALADLGPNLGSLNRSALVASDHVVVPLSPDLFSLQGLSNLGPTLRRWRTEWQDRVSKNPDDDLKIPDGAMNPAGYVVLQHAVRLDRPVKAYDKWIRRIPQVYRKGVLDEPEDETVSVGNDPHALALLKHYRSLMPMAQEVRKPLFSLRPADGAIGAHYQAVQEAYKDFEALARRIADSTGAALQPVGLPRSGSVM